MHMHLGKTKLNCTLEFLLDVHSVNFCPKCSENVDKNVKKEE